MVIGDEKWIIRKVETKTLGNRTLFATVISPLVRDREAIFLADLEQVEVVDPAMVGLLTAWESGAG